MSHKIQVKGSFGSADSLKDILNEQGVKFEEKEENGKTFLTFPDSRYNLYGNPLRICTSHPEDSTMDADIGRTVAGWYRDAMTNHVKIQALRQGARVTSETKRGNNIVLRLAVG